MALSPGYERNTVDLGTDNSDFEVEDTNATIIEKTDTINIGYTDNFISFTGDEVEGITVITVPQKVLATLIGLSSEHFHFSEKSNNPNLVVTTPLETIEYAFQINKILFKE